jgi:endo-1,4-beta-xylanase
MNRRQALKLGLTALAGMGGSIAVARVTQPQPQSSNRNQDRVLVDEDAPLRQHASAKGLIYGASARYRNLSTDAAFAASFVRECDLLVPGNDLKWQILRPSPDRFDFTQADWMANFVRDRGMLFRGHTLVWHQSLPRWFRHIVNHQNAERFLIEHITTVAGHYAGRMHSWDVVNEAISLASERSDHLHPSPWLEFLGADYIDLAFRVAAEADPDALLVYNDNGMDHDTRGAEGKRVAILNLLEQLVDKGTPIHALGIQAHLFRQSHERRFNPEKLSRFLNDVASLGLKIMITELDVTDRYFPLEIETRDRMVAQAYEDYLSIVLEQPAVIAVITWGLSDRYTWLEKFRPREDGAPTRPLPLDHQLHRKLAWDAVARAFDNAPVRNL